MKIEKVKRIGFNILIYISAVIFIVSFLLIDLEKRGILFLGKDAIRRLIIAMMIGEICSLFAYAIIVLVIEIIKSFSNIKSSDIAIFDLIDNYRIHWKENNAVYIRQIQVINYVYKSKDIIELQKRQDLEKLFIRRDTLKTRINLYNDMQTAFISLVLSGVASIIIISIMDSNSINEEIGLLIVAMFLLVYAIFVRYVERGHGKSFLYQVNEYELQLLEQIINDIEKRILVNDESMEVLETKRTLIKYLISQIHFAKRKEKRKIIEDIEKIESLNLFLEDWKNVEFKDIQIKEGVIRLYYTTQGAESDCLGNYNPINLEYKDLYQILCEYNLIKDGDF